MFSVSNRIFKQAIHRLTSNKIILKIIAGQSTKNSVFFYWEIGRLWYDLQYFSAEITWLQNA